MKLKSFSQYRLSCKRVNEKRFRTWDYFPTLEQAQTCGNGLIEKKWITSYKVIFNGKSICKE